jgi:hypothetical protein
LRKLNAKRFAHLQEIEAHEIGRPHFRLKNPLAAGLGDFIVQPEWDGYFVAASTACVAQTLFQVPANQPFTITGGATFTKTLQTTSMQTAGQLQAPERLLVRGITVYCDNLMNQGDTAKLLSQTILNFFVSTKSFCVLGLLGKLPAGGGAWAQQANIAATTVAVMSVTGNGLPSEHQGYQLTAPGVSSADPASSMPQIDGVLIAQQQAFRVIIDPTQAAHIAAAGFTTAATGAVPPGIGVNAWVYLEGTKARAVL